MLSTDASMLIPYVTLHRTGHKRKKKRKKKEEKASSLREERTSQTTVTLQAQYTGSSCSSKALAPSNSSVQTLWARYLLKITIFGTITMRKAIPLQATILNRIPSHKLFIRT